MLSKHHEIESIIEDLIENTIFEVFADSFSSPKECEYALEILKEKLDEIDTKSFKTLYE